MAPLAWPHRCLGPHLSLRLAPDEEVGSCRTCSTSPPGKCDGWLYKNPFNAANGYHPILDYRRALAPKGVYVMAGGTMAQIFQAMLLGPWILMTGSKKMGGLAAKVVQKDLVYIKGLLEAGKIRPVMDRRYPLSEVPEALRYLGEGHARGKVVITF